MAAHALLSPSGASRWMACTPSARLEQSVPDRAGQAAAEGTLAHRLAEVMLQFRLGLIRKTAYNKEVKLIKENELYNEEMWNYMEEYAHYVLTQYDLAKQRTKDAKIFLETKLDMSDYVPEGFGTGDVCIVPDDIWDFIDLKYGKGVPVSAVENKQMMLYALGLLKEFDVLYRVHTIRMTIYQPRLDSISTWEISVEDLLDWAENVVKPKARLAFEGKGDFNPGPHCQFCRVNATCRANHDYHMEIVKHDFADPELLTDDEISEVLGKVASVVKWAEKVKDYALMQAIHNGKQWPNYKLVEGKSSRKYTDENAVADKLIAMGIPEDKIFKPKSIVGITELTKNVGKKIFTEVVDPLCVKPPGAPTLAPETDPRPVYSAEATPHDFFDDFVDE